MSNKKGPLSKVEKFYIKHRYKEDGVDSLANDLDRAKSTIKRYIGRCKDDEYKDVQQQFSAGALYAQANGAVIATQSASEYGDEIRSNSKKVSKRQAKCVTTTNKLPDE